jgi:nitroimidazol reductase NimA-like FMN-containing flavoprotein (pyridoxamine 5'-phosphate oxidase superfamily)
MRRKEKEITDRIQIDTIINRAFVCRLALSDGKRPYVVPLSFGYDGSCLYFHCAEQGKKIDIMKMNPLVCFEIDIDCEPISSTSSCAWSMKYSSVIGYGNATFVDDIVLKREALEIILSHYSDTRVEIPLEAIRNTVIIKVKIESMTGKRSG